MREGFDTVSKDINVYFLNFLLWILTHFCTQARIPQRFKYAHAVAFIDITDDS